MKIGLDRIFAYAPPGTLERTALGAVMDLQQLHDAVRTRVD